MPIINHTSDKYDADLDSLPLNLVYFVLKNGNNVLENIISLAVKTMIIYQQPGEFDTK